MIEDSDSSSMLIALTALVLSRHVIGMDSYFFRRLSRMNSACIPFFCLCLEAFAEPIANELLPEFKRAAEEEIREKFELIEGLDNVRGRVGVSDSVHYLGIFEQSEACRYSNRTTFLCCIHHHLTRLLLARRAACLAFVARSGRNCSSYTWHGPAVHDPDLRYAAPCPAPPSPNRPRWATAPLVSTDGIRRNQGGQNVPSKPEWKANFITPCRRPAPTVLAHFRPTFHHGFDDMSTG
jgi:hypothetical protein